MARLRRSWAGSDCVDERGALGLGYSLRALVTALGQQLVDEFVGIGKEAGDIRPDRGLQLLTLDRGAYALASERAAMGHGAVAAVARAPGPGAAEGEAADGAADERAEEVGMARVAGHGAVALESGDGGVPDVLRDQRRYGSGNHLTTVGLRGPAAVLEDAPVDGIDDEVADMTGAPEALGATASDTATVAAIGGGDAERVELGSDMRTSPAVRWPGGDRCA